MLGSTQTPPLQRMLRTQNLLLRSYQPEDTSELFGFMSDPVAMQFTYIAQSFAECKARLTSYEAMRATLGFAPWVVLWLETGNVVGWGGLSVDPEEPEWGLELSYAFSAQHWGKGFATELVQYSLAHAFAVLSAKEVNSFAKPANTGSIRVLEKCGFQFLGYASSLERSHYCVHAPGAA